MYHNTINADVTLGGSEGTLLANRYRVIRQLGQGGMGSVWLAADTQLDNREVAIKMLPSILVSNKRAYNQLKSEALVSLKLTHPNIAAVRAFEENGGNPFLVVDYIDGVTLDDYLADKGKLSEDEAIRLLEPIASALDYAHSKGVVHRDVKPANVMIAKDGTPYILDFGIAREIQETMTRVTGKLSSGTLMYMSPEQLHGAAPKASQDVYSFAAMAYECLMGTPPFSRGQIEYQIEHDSPAPIDPQFAKCGSGIMAGLAKSPEDRPENCLGVLSAGRMDIESRTDKCRAKKVAKLAKTDLLVKGKKHGASLSSKWKMNLALMGVLLIFVALSVLRFCKMDSSTEDAKNEIKCERRHSISSNSKSSQKFEGKSIFTGEEMADRIVNGVDYSKEELASMSDEELDHFTRLRDRWYQLHPTPQMRQKKMNDRLMEAENLQKMSEAVANWTKGDEDYAEDNRIAARTSDFLKQHPMVYANMDDEKSDRVKALVNARYDAAQKRRSFRTKVFDTFKYWCGWIEKIFYQGMYSLGAGHIFSGIDSEGLKGIQRSAELDAITTPIKKHTGSK